MTPKQKILILVSVVYSVFAGLFVSFEFDEINEFLFIFLLVTAPVWIFWSLAWVSDNFRQKLTNPNSYPPPEAKRSNGSACAEQDLMPDKYYGLKGWAAFIGAILGLGVIATLLSLILSVAGVINGDANSIWSSLINTAYFIVLLGCSLSLGNRRKSFRAWTAGLTLLNLTITGLLMSLGYSLDSEITVGFLIPAFVSTLIFLYSIFSKRIKRTIYQSHESVRQKQNNKRREPSIHI